MEALILTLCATSQLCSSENLTFQGILVALVTATATAGFCYGFIVSTVSAVMSDSDEKSQPQSEPID